MGWMTLRSILIAATLAAAPLHAPAAPGEGTVALEILPGWRTDRGTHIAGIRIRLAPGWKTYWRAPGDAGIPPEVTWSGAENVAAARFHWPVPEVWTSNGMRSIGYADEVVIPVEFDTPAPGESAHVAGEIDFGVCHDICVPVRIAFTADLPSEGRRDPAIAAALVDRPLTAAEAGVTGTSCRVERAGDGLRLTAHLTLPATGGVEEVVIETGDPGLWVADPATRREGGTLIATTEILPPPGSIAALDRSALRFTVIGADHAVDILGCAAE